MPKKSKPVEPVPEPEPEEEQVTCPVCGKPVGLTVASCPNCGAEFEEETEEQAAEEEAQVEEPEEVKPAKAEPQPVQEAAPVDEEEVAECPVCGKQVALSLSSCPNCGAEFEEEEVEEVIEVEEKEVPVEEPKAEVEVPQEATEEVQVEEEAEIESVARPHPTSVVDLRVIGVSLIILGIIGSQISAMIDWYWTWVPPIENNLPMFLGIAAIVIVAGLLVYMLVQKAKASGKKVPGMMPNMSLSLFLFGILALVMIMLWNPINAALQRSSLGVAGAFLGVLIVGVLSMIMGQRMSDKRASAS